MTWFRMMLVLIFGCCIAFTATSASADHRHRGGYGQGFGGSSWGYSGFRSYGYGRGFDPSPPRWNGPYNYGFGPATSGGYGHAFNLPPMGSYSRPNVTFVIQAGSSGGGCTCGHCR